MVMKGQGTPMPLSADIAMEIVEIGAKWRLALVDGVVTDEEAKEIKRDWDRFAPRAGLLAATVDLVCTALSGTQGMESKRFIDKVMPLKRRKLTVIYAEHQPQEAA